MSNKGGRPPKLQPELETVLIQAVRAGNTIDTSCALAGIRRQTLRNWMRAGAKQRTGAYRQFLDRIKKALAEAEALHVTNITAVARGRPGSERRTETVDETTGHKTIIIERTGGMAPQWTASAWWLERRNPKRFSRTLRMEGGDPARPVVFEVKLDRPLGQMAPRDGALDDDDDDPAPAANTLRP